MNIIHYGDPWLEPFFPSQLQELGLISAIPGRAGIAGFVQFVRKKGDLVEQSAVGFDFGQAGCSRPVTSQAPSCLGEAGLTAGLQLIRRNHRLTTTLTGRG